MPLETTWQEKDLQKSLFAHKGEMSEQAKLMVHFVVSKLVILAVPLLNQILSFAGITVNTSNSTIDSLANCICIALGLAYSYWTKKRAERVHTDAGFNEGVKAATGVDPVKVSDTAPTVQTVSTVLEIPFNKPTSPVKPVDSIDK